MKCPNEDCLGVFTNPDQLCRRCGHELNESQRQQFMAEEQNSFRPTINHSVDALEWGGLDYPTSR